MPLTNGREFSVKKDESINSKQTSDLIKITSQNPG